jgi:hypothetical protein
MKTRLLLLVLALFSVTAVAQDVQFHGFIDSYHAARTHDPYDFLSSRTRLRLEGTWYADDSMAFASVDLEQNNVLDDYDELKLREAYIDYFGNNWDVRVGKQIIVWGKTEGLQILDAVSPWDFSEFLARDFEDLRIGVDAVRFRFLQDSWTLELIYLPQFQPAMLAPADSPWSFDPTGTGASLNQVDEPEFNLENGEYGARLLFYQDWGDLSFVALRSWSDEPYPFITPDRNKLTSGINFRYQRLDIAGIGISIPQGDFIFRGEAAVYRGAEMMDMRSPGSEIKEYNQFKWVAGLEWLPGDGWNLAIQLTDSQVLDYQPGIYLPKHNRMMTLSLSKSLLREKLTISSFSFIGLEHGDTFSRISGDYSLSDAVHLLAGYDLFTGDEGYLAAFNNNDEVWTKFKYSF